MSYQVWLDSVEEKTGKTPREFVALALDRGLDGPDVTAGSVIEWLKTEFDLGRGHSVAILHVIQKSARVGTIDVGFDDYELDDPDALWLDGKASKPV